MADPELGYQVIIIALSWPEETFATTLMNRKPQCPALRLANFLLTLTKMMNMR